MRISAVIPTYRDSQQAQALVRALHDQRLPDSWKLEVIVVDDGSGSPHAERIAALADDVTSVVILPSNVGRTLARDTGIRRASGELLMLIDSDCMPAHTQFLAAHINSMTDVTVVASTGPVQGHDNGFWSRYQDTVMERRLLRSANIQGMLGSTANICIRRDAYYGAGGLDHGYAGYGFEDRDLLLRLAEVGTVTWTSDAAVLHRDELTLAGVCAKVADAGHRNSAAFARRHPVAYRHLGYAALDARQRRMLQPVARILDPVIPKVAAFVDTFLERIPFPMARFLVKAVSALAFMAGTSRRNQAARP